MYTEVVGRQSTYTLPVAKARGTIYDRNGEPLTNAQEKYIAAVVPNVESVSRLNAAAGSDRREELRVALENGKPFLIEINTPVNADGIRTFRVFERYSEKQPASNLIGYLENGETGADGIEKSFDSMLAANGGEIRVTFTIDALGNAISGAELLVEDTYSRARDGVVLTLDKEIQIALEEACAAIDKGAAVVLDCKTGGYSGIGELSGRRSQSSRRMPCGRGRALCQPRAERLCARLRLQALRGGCRAGGGRGLPGRLRLHGQHRG